MTSKLFSAALSDCGFHQIRLNRHVHGKVQSSPGATEASASSALESGDKAKEKEVSEATPNTQT